ncbi:MULTISPECIES: DUF6531 domain-containing protein [Pseudomonas]|uniref:DUF6531 domain-containing protein n=1 Tax=Pseudomonas TaxID=286 RepID=UPI001BEC0430|nr:MULTISPECIES: DUF6531 domain-containing protein [Pseudomonas]MBT2338425.1 RHS repeat protein [Pseudomonas fluorescens]MCD4531127.1 DUF6531 domain-containing protein [Pseudomonas sp. C3-2018]
MLRKRLFSCSLFFLSLTASTWTFAGEYYWIISELPVNIQQRQPSPESACRWLYEEYGKIWNYTPAEPTEDVRFWNCHMIFGDDPLDDSYGVVSIARNGDTCITDQRFNRTSGQCESQGVDHSCPATTAGNPINFATGYKIQSESDYSATRKKPNADHLEFSKFYRSTDGLWSHSYSSRLIFEEDAATFISHDGNQFSFEKNGDLYEAKLPEAGRLMALSNGWSYHAPDNRILEFDSDGKLRGIAKHDHILRISHSNKASTVTDGFGNSLEFTEDTKKQPLSVITKTANIRYSYNDYMQLISMTKVYPNHSESRHYTYQDPKDSRLLTGITDERGVLYATWTYDDRGRAITSEHAGGLEKISISYNADGSSTVTNALGKQTRYHFELIQGIRRIKSIEGMPSTNCPDTNAVFSYDTHGLLKTRLDNNGNITTYTYNDRRLESSRTEASGTSQARTITTEWHPTLFSPTRINEPDRSTQYTYDTQGHLLSKTVTTR